MIRIGFHRYSFSASNLQGFKGSNYLRGMAEFDIGSLLDFVKDPEKDA